jgi:exonuclease SbcD
MGICKVESIPLIPKHDVRRIEGTMDDLLNSRIELGKRDDYVQVSLLDQGAVFDASGRLRDVFPNFIGIDRAGLMNPSAKIERPDHRQRDVAGLFKEFYQFVTNEALTEEQGKVLARIANKVRQSERDE